MSLMLIFKASTLGFFTTFALLYFFCGLLFPAATFYASSAIEDKASASSMMSFINIGSAMLFVIIMGYLPGNPLEQLILTITLFLAILFASGIHYLYKKRNP
ncbi:hypothetical protein [Fastidiosibacter lacustris]|uniref:hypothetical protein n=1 Tax=Fastidiosibacter lacustris TaxID=2056695 RepID=UPI000E354C7E|nr:hypothetical protein [Fastidiosibacter lacustris]